MIKCQMCGTAVEDDIEVCPVCSTIIDTEYVDLYQLYLDSLIEDETEESYEKEIRKDVSDFIKKDDGTIRKTK